MDNNQLPTGTTWNNNFIVKIQNFFINRCFKSWSIRAYIFNVVSATIVVCYCGFIIFTVIMFRQFSCQLICFLTGFVFICENQGLNIETFNTLYLHLEIWVLYSSLISAQSRFIFSSTEFGSSWWTMSHSTEPYANWSDPNYLQCIQPRANDFSETPATLMSGCCNGRCVKKT